MPTAARRRRFVVAERVTHLPLPPHSVQAEQNVLGALLLDGAKLWPLIAPILKPDDFYRADHRVVFAAMAELLARGSAVDVVTTIAHLEARREIDAAGGMAYLSSLARETTTGANIEHYAKVVRERSQLRKLAEFGRSVEKLALGDDGDSAETIAGRASSQLMKIQANASGGAGLIVISDIAKQLLDDLDARREGKRGLATGIVDFDHLTGGLEAGELTIFAGRPGMGKTALLCTVAAHVARESWAAIFSAEMPALQLGRRMLALLGGPAQDKLRRPERMTEDDWVSVTDAMRLLTERRIAIDDRQAPTMEHIRAECLGFKARMGLGLVMVDYLQLAQAAGANRYESLLNVAYSGKALAKELACPVVMLAQLNRGVETRDNKRPKMSDLRDSGGIEEAADLICLLYREGYYDDTFDMPNVIECMIEKNRNGERGQCLWNFSGEFSRMTALDEAARAQYRHVIRSRKGTAGE